MASAGALLCLVLIAFRCSWALDLTSTTTAKFTELATAQPMVDSASLRESTHDLHLTTAQPKVFDSAQLSMTKATTSTATHLTDIKLETLAGKKVTHPIADPTAVGAVVLSTVPSSTRKMHDDTSEPTMFRESTSIGPWRLVTAEGEKLSVANKRYNRLHRHRTTTLSPSTDLETQLTLEGGDEDNAGQQSGSSSQSPATTTSSAPKHLSKPLVDTEEVGDQPAAKSTETEIVISESSEPVKPHYKLVYFDARGICESIRLLFRYANETFVDERITKKKWIAIKDSTFFGKIPILEVDGKPLAQCYAISRYLARQFHLAGADDWEAANADFHKGVHNEISPYIFVLSGYRQGDRDMLRKDLFIPTVEKNFPIYVNLLKQSASGFFGKSGVSWVDFVVSEYMMTIRSYEPLIMEKYPVISRFIDKVQALPQIKDYIKTRAKTPLQFQY